MHHKRHRLNKRIVLMKVRGTVVRHCYIKRLKAFYVPKESYIGAICRRIIADWRTKNAS